MPPRKRGKNKPNNIDALKRKAHIEGSGMVVNQKISDTLQINYMPYAMSVILSRAIPEIDGFKPSHRKLLYTMYKMGLLTGARTKSANIVGQTMRLNPHGDTAIYDTMVRLSRGYETLLYPYVDSKGNFGKAYSRDMQWAAARYTEAKLDAIANELFREIDKDTVDFVDNYDSTMKEPSLLPVTFPTILSNSNTGIAVGMTSSICSFNLKEVCETTIELMKNPDHNIADTLIAPDFPGGGQIIYNRDDLEKIYASGRGGIKIRSKYKYDKANNCIDIKEIPPTTTIEAVIDKIIEHVKSGKIREISDIRDETGIDGLKITIDLKRGIDPDNLMRKLFRMTTLQDTFSCNFNVLIGGAPRVVGVAELLTEWTAFRMSCVRRRVYYDLTKMKDKLHLLQGLAKILLDIDKAIKIIRETDEENEVVPNLMIGFGIDEKQAEYVAEIKLRHLNREYILKRTEEIEKLEKDILDLEDIYNSDKKIKSIIIKELRETVKKYSKERKSEIIYVNEIDEPEIEEIPSYPVNLFLTSEGYFKKITPLSLRMGGEHKLKDGDKINQIIESSNNRELLFFTNQQKVYKTKISEFEDMKASLLGVYIVSKLEMDENEAPIYMAETGDYSGFMLYIFENGKIAKVEMESYYTKTNRKKLVKAYSGQAPLAAAIFLKEDQDILIQSSAGRMLIINTGALLAKSARDTQGVAVMTLKSGHKIISAREYNEGDLDNPKRYRPKTIPSAGFLPPREDKSGQLHM